MKNYILQKLEDQNLENKFDWSYFMPAGLMIGLYLTNISSGFNSIGINQQLVSLISKAFILICFLFCIPSIISNKINATLNIVLITALLTTLNYLFYSIMNLPDLYLNNTIITFVTQCLPGLLVVSNTNSSDYMLMLKYLRVSSICIALFSLLLLLLDIIGINLFSIDGYSMGLGYSLVLPSMILLYDYSDKNNISSLLLSLAALLFIVMYGSRGAILSIVLYFIYSAIIRNFIEQKYTIRTLIITIFSFIISLEFRKILMAIYNIMIAKGYFSRTLYLFLFDFSHSSNRTDVYSKIINVIFDDPFAFRGISSDYLLLGTYSHNMIIEIVYEFGLLIAIPIILYLIVLIYKTLSIKNTDPLLIIYFFSSVPGLMLSGSFWHNSNFWIWIALIYSHFGDRYEKENNS